MEHGVPSVSSRIQAMKKLTDRGWQVGLRIDPLIDCEDFSTRYQNLFQDIFLSIPREKIHSVSLGTFRMPTTFFKKMEKLHPQEKLFSGRLENRSGTVAYRQKSSGKEKKPVFNYYYNTSLPKRFLIAKSLLAPTPKKIGITIRLHFIKIFSTQYHHGTPP